MENKYIQQLRFILTTEYNVNPEELEKIIEDYRLTVETIIDETGDEKNVVDQLGAPRVLAEEIAQEFKFTKKPVSEASTWEQQKNETDLKDTIKKSVSTVPTWVKVVAIVVCALILLPTVASIVGIAIGGIFLGLGLIVTGIILIPQFLNNSPWLIIMLFVAGISTLIFMFMVISLAIRGIIYLVRLAFGKKKEMKQPRKKWGFIPWTLVILAMLIAHASLITIVATNKDIRDKLPYQMYRFKLSHSGTTEVNKKTFEKSEIQKLTIKGSGTSINLKESADDQYHISVYASDTEVRDTIALDNGELKVNMNSGNAACFICVNSGEDTEIVVEIPKNAKQELVYLEITGGDANVQTLLANKINMKVTGGSLQTNTIETESLNVNITGGKSTFDSINTKTSKMNVSGGSIKISTMTAAEGIFDVTGGSINIEKGNIEKVDRNITGGSVDIG